MSVHSMNLDLFWLLFCCGLLSAPTLAQGTLFKAGVALFDLKHVFRMKAASAKLGTHAGQAVLFRYTRLGFTLSPPIKGSK